MDLESIKILSPQVFKPSTVKQNGHSQEIATGFPAAISRTKNKWLNTKWIKDIAEITQSIYNYGDRTQNVF